MRHKGPMITVLAGLVLGLVLTGMSAMAGTSDSAATRDAAVTVADTRSSAPPPPAGGSAPPSATASPSASPSASASAGPEVPAAALYAGRLPGSRATIAISLAGGKAVAYVCDGYNEAWLRGTAVGGRISLTGKGGNSFSGRFDARAVRGTLQFAGTRFDVTASATRRPAGLYQATAEVRRVRLVTTWIVLPDGSQVGVALKGGVTAPAPRLDPSTGRATVDGTPVTATPVDPTKPAS